MNLPGRVERAIRSATPPVCAYVYDLPTVLGNVRALRAALPDGARVAYAMKANGNPAVLAALAAQCDAIEVASAGELAAAVAAGAGSILFSGPAKTDADLTAAVAAGAVLNVESLHELRRLGTLAGAAGARVALRVNRAHLALPGRHQMSGVPTAFGLDESLLAPAVAVAAAAGLDVVGFHLHAVSNNLDAAAHAAFIRDALAWAVDAASRLGVDLRTVNVGGGLGVDLVGADRFDLSRLAGLPAQPRLVVEPGRFVVADAGWYAAEVIDVKRNLGRWFVVVRGGTHHFRLPASWGYSHPFTVLPVPAWPYGFDRPAVEGGPVDVVGEQCNPRDVLARDVPVDRVRAGDVLVFANTGAYGWEVAHHDFLRHRPPEMIITGVGGDR